MKDLKMYVPSLRFLIMVAIAWVVITLVITQAVPTSSKWGLKVRQLFGWNLPPTA